MTSEVASRVEFAVKINGPSCVENVKAKLKENGIKSDQISDSLVDSQNRELRLVIGERHRRIDSIPDVP